MKKGLLAIPVGGVVAALVAVGASSIKPWSWETSTKDNTINYCLLIGQTDHNDSAARTGGIRDKLGTRATVKTSNANTESAKQGKLRFNFTDKPSVTYTINELESKTCVSTTGATWDQGTAVIAANNWYSKYKDNLTMVISNNDGMAEGASFALNCPKNMPIFGYDSNESTLRLIMDDQITGTINSNAPAQAVAMNIMACRILDGTYDAETHTGDQIFSTLFKGFYCVDENGNPKSTDACKGTTDPYIMNDWITDIEGNKVTFTYVEKDHALLVSSNAVDDKEKAQTFNKTPAEQFEKIHTITEEQKIKRTSNYNFFHSAYSMTDTYLTSTMNPLVKIARSRYGIADNPIIYGDGNNEDEITNQLERLDAQDAYLVNMTKTVNSDKYVSSTDAETGKPVQGIIEKNLQGSGKDYKKTPIIFYNRQPSSSECFDYTKNGGNKYVFYVGFDADSGAQLQGQMIQDWLKNKVGADSVEIL